MPFHGYAAGGPEDDHEGTRAEDAVARVRQGMKAMLRFGSGWLDVAEGVRAITEMGLELTPLYSCAPTTRIQQLWSTKGMSTGQSNRRLLHGIAPITAIQMTTINTAEHFGLSRDIGMIAPGRYADILLLSDLAELKIDLVIAKGQLAAEGKKPG